MTDTTPETNLETIRRHVADAETRVMQQRLLLKSAVAVKDKKAAAHARELLNLMLVSLGQFRLHLALIEAHLCWEAGDRGERQ
jgi:alkylation response protein AidB-like acyl-CoA dehydrogenase